MYSYKNFIKESLHNLAAFIIASMFIVVYLYITDERKDLSGNVHINRDIKQITNVDIYYGK